jgi:hypothetical protein
LELLHIYGWPIAAFVIAVAAILAGLEFVEANLRLEVTAAAGRSRAPGDVTISVRLVNAGPEPVWVMPHFIGMKDAWHAQLEIQVTDEDGRKVPEVRPKSDEWVVKAVTPSICDLLLLLPGEEFGERISLAQGAYGHRLVTGRRYRVRAVLTASMEAARESAKTSGEQDRAIQSVVRKD